MHVIYVHKCSNLFNSFKLFILFIGSISVNYIQTRRRATVLRAQSMWYHPSRKEWCTLRGLLQAPRRMQPNMLKGAACQSNRYRPRQKQQKQLSQFQPKCYMWIHLGTAGHPNHPSPLFCIRWIHFVSVYKFSFISFYNLLYPFVSVSILLIPFNSVYIYIYIYPFDSFYILLCPDYEKAQISSDRTGSCQDSFQYFFCGLTAEIAKHHFHFFSDLPNRFKLIQIESNWSKLIISAVWRGATILQEQ